MRLFFWEQLVHFSSTSNLNKPLFNSFKLALQREPSLVRKRQVLQSPQASLIKVAGKKYISFASNDYLGLANDPQVIAALQQGAKIWGVGSGAADLVTGHSQIQEDLEQALAEATGREAALLFTSGYQANLAVISSLVGRKDVVLQDKLNHASLLDGAKLAGAKLLRYQHCQLASLQQLLAKTSTTSGLVITDAVFSMDGNIAPLKEISQLVAVTPNKLLMLDDAHGFGVLGPKGAGTAVSLGLTQGDAPVLMATLGKALGTSGAFIAGSSHLINSLIQFARPYIYSTAYSPALAFASLASLKLMQSQAWRQEKLAELIAYFKQSANQLGLEVAPSNTAIQPLIVGNACLALRLADYLRQQGLWVVAIRPPTVPQGSARLRITLNATHTKPQVSQLLTALVAGLQQFTV